MNEATEVIVAHAESRASFPSINLPDTLAADAKARAAAEGRTFTSLVAEGLRSVLASRRSPSNAQPVPLPAFGDPNDRLLVDLADRDAVWAALEDDHHR